MHGPTRYLNDADGEHKAKSDLVQQLFNLHKDH
jgi:hypothetical protein